MNIMKIMQQAKAMQGKMSDIQDKLAQTAVTGSAGGGAVSITMTCKGYVQAVSIKQGVIDPTDPTMLEDLVKAAINDARQKADDTTESETKSAMSGLGLPSDFKLPF